jgi:hypothetical protein
MLQTFLEHVLFVKHHDKECLRDRVNERQSIVQYASLVRSLTHQLLADWHKKGLTKHLPHSTIFDTIIKQWPKSEPIDETLRTKSKQDFTAVLVPLIDKLATVSH